MPLSSPVRPASFPAIWIEPLEGRRLFNGVAMGENVMVMEPLPAPAGTVGFELVEGGGSLERDASRFSVELGKLRYGYPVQMVMWGTPADRPPAPPPGEVVSPGRDPRPDPWTVDWGDGTRAYSHVSMEDGGLTIAEAHAYVVPGDYTITLTPPYSTPAGPYTYVVTATAYRRGAGLEVLEMPDVVVHADPYDAHPVNTVTLMRFRADHHAGNLYDYAVNVHLNRQWYSFDGIASLVPVAGAPGVYDVVIEGHFAHEGDFDVEVDITRGTGYRRRAGDMMYSSWDEAVARIHGRVVVSGRYEPVFFEAADGEPDLPRPTTDDSGDHAAQPPPTDAAAHSSSSPFSKRAGTWFPSTATTSVMSLLEGVDDDDLLAAYDADHCCCSAQW